MQRDRPEPRTILWRKEGEEDERYELLVGVGLLAAIPGLVYY